MISFNKAASNKALECNSNSLVESQNRRLTGRTGSVVEGVAFDVRLVTRRVETVARASQGEDAQVHVEDGRVQERR